MNDFKLPIYKYKDELIKVTKKPQCFNCRKSNR